MQPKQLNEQQQAIVNARSDRTIVLAGAGTGKTASAVAWVAGLISEGVPAEEIVMVTFTRKAANAMKDRLIQAVGMEAKLVTIGTYHAIAAKFIKLYPNHFDLTSPDFSIIDDDDSNSLILESFRQLGLKSKTPFTTRVVGRIISNHINKLEDLLTCTEEESLEDYYDTLEKVMHRYNLLKRHANALDYDDLLVMLLKALKSTLGEKLRKRYTHILVDEFQDNNSLNYQIITHWNPKRLMVIGDKQQSIYRFRGANPELIESFISENPKTEVLRLENNYRSGQDILDCANRIISGSKHALTLLSNTNEVADLSIREYRRLKEEAYSVAKDIVRDIKSTKPKEVAVLCRTGRGLIALEVELRRLRVNYKKYGGVALADNAAIKDFLAILRVHHNKKDKIALVRALLLLPNVGNATANKVMSNWNPSQDELDIVIEELPEKAKMLGDWLKDLKNIEGLTAKGKYLLEKITPLILARYPDDYITRLGDIQEVVNLMDEEANLGSFLELFVLHKGYEKDHPDDAITLSTIHSAKGLEWDLVYLFNCSDAVIPGKLIKTRADLEEARRLLYVAVTRGRYSLTVTCNDENGGMTSLWK